MVLVRDLLLAFFLSFLDVVDSLSSSYLALWILVHVSKCILKGMFKPNSPTVPNHAHALGFSHAIKLGTLPEIFLAANTLSIAETSFSQRIDITPV